MRFQLPGGLAEASYQVCSFGMHRVSLIGRYRHEPSGFVAGVEGYFDQADNDYKIDVRAADERGGLPSPDELFGDAVLIGPSLDLEPETSHNANFSPRSEIKSPRWGHLIADVNAFMRETDKQIVLLGDDGAFAYENVFLARSLGVEGTSLWTSPGRWVELQFSMTYQDLRNQSTRGPFATFKGDRLPNRPWLFGSWGAQLRFADLIARGDELEPFYLGRYTHEFYRGWESVGLRDFKQSVDTMLSHGLGITYGFNVGPGHLDVTVEAQNVTDAKLYDFFGVQRPGRAFYAKIAGDI